jgi:hypothetical protein
MQFQRQQKEALSSVFILVSMASQVIMRKKVEQHCKVIGRFDG